MISLYKITTLHILRLQLLSENITNAFAHFKWQSVYELLIFTK